MRRNFLRAKTASMLPPRLLEKDSVPQKTLLPKPIHFPFFYIQVFSFLIRRTQPVVPHPTGPPAAATLRKFPPPPPARVTSTATSAPNNAPRVSIWPPVFSFPEIF